MFNPIFSFWEQMLVWNTRIVKQTQQSSFLSLKEYFQREILSEKYTVGFKKWKLIDIEISFTYIVKSIVNLWKNPLSASSSIPKNPNYLLLIYISCLQFQWPCQSVYDIISVSFNWLLISVDHEHGNYLPRTRHASNQK